MGVVTAEKEVRRRDDEEKEEKMKSGDNKILFIPVSHPIPNHQHFHSL